MKVIKCFPILTSLKQPTRWPPLLFRGDEPIWTPPVDRRLTNDWLSKVTFLDIESFFKYVNLSSSKVKILKWVSHTKVSIFNSCHLPLETKISEKSKHKFERFFSEKTKTGSGWMAYNEPVIVWKNYLYCNINLQWLIPSLKNFYPLPLYNVYSLSIELKTCMGLAFCNFVNNWYDLQNTKNINVNVTFIGLYT